MNKSIPHTPAPAPDRQRRQWLAAIGAGLGFSWAGVTHAPPGRGKRAYRLLLNTGLSGPVAFVLLAQDKGCLLDAGLDVQSSGGPGAAAVVPTVGEGAFESGYGDISALFERIARGRPGAGPVAVHTMFDVVPVTIVVDAGGSIKQPRDLPGKRILGHASDAALLTFDLYAEAAGFDVHGVKVDGSMGSMGSAVKEMLRGHGADGVFGFVNTLIAAAAPFGVVPESMRFLNGSDALPEIYGNTLLVTRQTCQRDRPAVQGLVRTINRGLADTVRNRHAAIEPLLPHAPASDRAVNLRRLQGTLAIEMAHSEGRRIGIGDMDDERLQRLIDGIVRVKRLPRTPSVEEVFDRSLLPPLADRVRHLAG